MTAPPWILRRWRPDDSVAELTELLHAAYAPLGAAGMNFTAVDQTPAATAQRLQAAHTWVALQGGRLAGCISANAAFDPNQHAWARALPWFYRQDVAHFHQFAVAPALQGQGIGAALLGAAEDWARAAGHRAMLLDTAMPATALRQHYSRVGYADVDAVQWPGKTYRSVVMAKTLASPPPSADDVEHRAAAVRCLWASFQARDWPCARARLADDASLYWRASGEHLLDADATIRVQAIYPEGWSLQLVQATPLADGRVHSLVQVRHGGQCFIAHTLFSFRGRLISHADETWATAEPPPAWRTAEAIGAYRRDADFRPPPLP